jgi:hypothetical protein
LDAGAGSAGIVAHQQANGREAPPQSNATPQRGQRARAAGVDGGRGVSMDDIVIEKQAKMP